LNAGVRRAGLNIHVDHPIALLDRAYSSLPSSLSRRVSLRESGVASRNKKEK
jgi:hypothetical protein